MPSFPSRKLVNWFFTAQRKLPWRETYDPYHVLLSEVMAQQTQIKQMVPFFERFVKQFPTIQSLASAREENVLKAWEGLGYYSRARNLHKAAQQIVAEHNGKIPSSKEELSKLKGIGPYISSAIASIAFNQNEAVVDGNVLRVVSRVWGSEKDVSLQNTRKFFEEELKKTIPPGKARDFSQGLMELGALICTPNNPDCKACPLQKECVAFATNKQGFFPVKTKKSKPVDKHFLFAVLEQDGKYFITPRETPLLKGMWEFPSVEFQPGANDSGVLEERLSKIVCGEIRLEKTIGIIRHQYSHFTQHAHIVKTNPSQKINSPYFLSPADLKKKPLTTIQKKVLKQLDI